MKNLMKEFKHVEGLTDKRIVQKSSCEISIEAAMEYAQYVKDEGTSFERLHIKDNEIYFGHKFECEDMIVCLIESGNSSIADYDRFYRIVFGSDDKKCLECYISNGYSICRDNGKSASSIEEINKLDESEIIKEVLRRMFITLGEPCKETNKMVNIVKRFKHIEGLTDKRIIQAPRCCEDLESEAKEYADRIRTNKTTLESLYIKDGEIVFGDSVEFDDMIVCFVKPSDYDYHYMIFKEDDGFKVLVKLVKGATKAEEIDELELLNESETVKEVLRRMLLTIGK